MVAGELFRNLKQVYQQVEGLGEGDISGLKDHLSKKARRSRYVSACAAWAIQAFSDCWICSSGHLAGRIGVALVAQPAAEGFHVAALETAMSGEDVEAQPGDAGLDREHLCSALRGRSAAGPPA